MEHISQPSQSVRAMVHCINSEALYEVKSALEFHLKSEVSVLELMHKTVKNHLVTMKVNKIQSSLQRPFTTSFGRSA